MKSASARSRTARLLVTAFVGVALVSCSKASDVVGSAASETSGPTVVVPPRQTTTTQGVPQQPTSSTRPSTSTSLVGGGASTTVLAPSTSGGGSATSSTLGTGNGTGGSGGSGGSGSGSGGSDGSGSGSVTTTTAATTTTVDSGLAKHERTRLGKQPTGEERLVFDFTNRAPSSTDVRYVSNPVSVSGSAPVSVQGDNVLLVSMADATGVGSYVGNGYLSPDTMLQWGFTAVVEAVRVSDRNGELVWAIGVRGRPRFTVDRYDSRFILQVFP